MHLHVRKYTLNRRLSVLLCVVHIRHKHVASDIILLPQRQKLHAIRTNLPTARRAQSRIGRQVNILKSQLATEFTREIALQLTFAIVSGMSIVCRQRLLWILCHLTEFA